MFVKLINIVINGKRLTFLKNKKKHTSCICLGEGFEKGQWDKLPRHQIDLWLPITYPIIVISLPQKCDKLVTVSFIVYQVILYVHFVYR